MEKKLIVAIILLIAGLLGIGHLLSETKQGFESDSLEMEPMDYYEEEFQKFCWKHNKVYNSVNEETYRFNLFKNTLNQINEFNEQNSDVKVAMNQFGDLTDEEYKTYLNRGTSSSEKKQYAESQTVINRPSKVDWVGTLVWTGVYNQGSCGSCWAHSATQTLEGAYAKEYGHMQKLSIQELVDCVYPDKDTCREGGLEIEGMQWVKKHGICTESDYPRRYEARQGNCEKSKCDSVLNNINYVTYVPRAQVQKFLDYLSIGPLSVAIDANQFSFRYYSKGIITGRTSTSLDHAVLAVGFNTQVEEQYTKVKNSWGPGWGENGYFRVAITNDGGPLGVYQEPSMAFYKGEQRP